MAHIKTSIIEVKAETNCLSHALVISKVKATNDTNYNSYRRGYKIRPAVQNLLPSTGIDLSQGAGIAETERFQDHFGEYKIVVYEGLTCENIMYEGRVDSPTRNNLLYDEVTPQYHVIGSVTGAMAKRFVCKGCGKGCRRDSTHTCDQTCSDCMANPPYVFRDSNHLRGLQDTFGARHFSIITRHVKIRSPSANVIEIAAPAMGPSRNKTRNTSVVNDTEPHANETRRSVICATCNR
jgi:hypothetical protein